MHPVYQIEGKIRAYLKRDLSLQELREWFVAVRGPLLALPADLPGSKLATVLELGLIELKDGVLTERQFRKLLKDHIERSPQFIVEGPPDREFTSSESVTSTADGTFDVSPASIPRPRTLVGTSP